MNKQEELRQMFAKCKVEDLIKAFEKTKTKKLDRRHDKKYFIKYQGYKLPLKSVFLYLLNINYSEASIGKLIDTFTDIFKEDEIKKVDIELVPQEYFKEIFAKKEKRIKKFNLVNSISANENKLEDIISHDLNLLIVGETVGKKSVELNTYYADSSNKFREIICKYFLNIDTITPDSPGKLEDLLLKNKIGLTDFCKDKTHGKDIEVSNEEALQYIETIKQKIIQYKPKIVAINGRCGNLNKNLLKKFFNAKGELYFGKQDFELKGCDTIFYLLPSTSKRANKVKKVKQDFIKLDNLSSIDNITCWKKMAEIIK